MLERGFFLDLEFRNNSLSEYLSEFHAPLVKRINVPDNALSEYRMLIKSDKFAQCLGRELFNQNRVRWPVALKDPMRDEPIRRAFGLHLLGRLAESQRLGLSEDVRQ